MSDRTCKRCGGAVVIVERRAWCTGLYIDGGCGGTWRLVNSKWTEWPELSGRPAWVAPLAIEPPCARRGG